MPPVIIAAVSAVGSALGGTLGAAMIMGAEAIASGIIFAAQVVGAIGAYSYQQRKARDAYNASLRDRLVMTSMVDGARRFVLGKTRVAGDVVYKAVSGGKSEFYTLVVVVAGHRVKAIGDVYLGDVKATIVSNSVMTEPWGDRVARVPSTYATAPASGTSTTINFGSSVVEDVVVTYLDAQGVKQLAAITSSTSSSVTFTSVVGVVYTADYVVLRQLTYMIVKKFLGGDSQDIHAMVRDPASGVFNAQIEDSDKFRGMAGVVVMCSYDPTAFPGGVPTISAVVEGSDEIYDPRTGTTGYSENNALCARWVALHPNGGALTSADLDDSSFIAAANACDTAHTYVDSEGVSTSTVLYRCAYTGRWDSGPDPHFGALVEGMAGQYGWSGGRLRVVAGVYSAPAAVTIDETWLAGGVSVGRGRELDALVNVYRPTIADAAQDYVAVPLPELSIAPYIAEDGQELPDELPLAAVFFAPQAMHICGVRARDMRWGRTYKLVCNLKAYQLELFDVVRLNLPRYRAINKPVQVLEWAFNPRGQIVLTLKETDASIYQPDGVFAVRIPSSNTALTQPWYVPDITLNEPDSGENHVLIQSDGSVLTRVLMTWPAVTEASVLNGGYIDLSYSVAGSGVWSTERFDGSVPQQYLAGLRDGELYRFRARLATRLATGVWSPVRSHRVVGKSSPPPVPDVFTVRLMPDGTRVLEGGYTTTARPFDFAGWQIRYRQGVGPYGWGDLLPLQTDAGGLITSLPLETNLLTAGSWTLALAGVDSSRNVGEPLMIVGLLPNPRLGDSLVYYNLESQGWPGTLTDGVRDTFEGVPIIAARDQSTWASLTTWSAWTRWAHHPVASWTYQVNDEDLGAVVSTLPVVDIEGVGTFVTEEQHSVDGTTWTSWAAIVGSFMARYVRIRVSVTATGPTGAGVTQYTYLTSMRVVYTASVTQEVLEDVSPAALTGSYRIGVGDIRAPITGSYATVRVESVVIQSGAAGAWTWQVVDKATSPGPRVKFFNNGVAADPPLVDIVIKGIST